mmetsp:Transcript_198/g.622  ORF Transcript_198/g.622 Transcript_198/m.622 type:complete len:338 (-) Transcript_198:545-1558(-)
MPEQIRNQALGRAVLALRRGRPFDDGLQGRRQFLAKLNPPLIIGIDAQNDPFHKNAMLIKRDDLAQRERIKLGINQRCRRTIARKNAVRRLPLQVGSVERICDFDTGLIQGPAPHQGLRLGQAIGHQQRVVVGQFGFMPLGGDHEFTGDHRRALVDQLIKSVLAIGAGRAPHHGAAVHRQGQPIHAHGLAVRFHLKLLQIGRQLPQALIIGQHRARRITTNLPVPHAHQRQHQRHVLHTLRGTKMAVHLLPAAQKRAKTVRTNGHHQAQADRPPHGIAPADPILEAKDAGRRYAKIFSFFQAGREGRKLRRRITTMIAHPGPRGARIGHRLDRGKGF